MTATLIPSQQLLVPQLEIRGGKKLEGEVRVSGAKNSALVLMAASLLTENSLRLRNMPALSDIGGMADILSALGVQI
jgi:UDP-N-acetylglucosamine 1-carboxyvinyltransferase